MESMQRFALGKACIADIWRRGALSSLLTLAPSFEIESVSGKSGTTSGALQSPFLNAEVIVSSLTSEKKLDATGAGEAEGIKETKTMKESWVEEQVKSLEKHESRLMCPECRASVQKHAKDCRLAPTEDSSSSAATGKTVPDSFKVCVITTKLFQFATRFLPPPPPTPPTIFILFC